MIEGHKLFRRGPHVWPALLHDILRKSRTREELKTIHGNSVGIIRIFPGKHEIQDVQNTLYTASKWGSMLTT